MTVMASTVGENWSAMGVVRFVIIESPLCYLIPAGSGSSGAKGYGWRRGRRHNCCLFYSTRVDCDDSFRSLTQNRRKHLESCSYRGILSLSLPQPERPCHRFERPRLEVHCSSAI